LIVFRRRLFWKIYLTLLVSLVSVAVLIGVFWWLVGEGPREGQGSFHIHLSEKIVPERDNPPGAIAASVEQLSREMGADISVYDPQGALIASRGAPVLEGPNQPLGMGQRIIRIDLSDGRTLMGRLRPAGPHPGLRFLSILLIVAGGVALAAFPLTARLTRRLETLRFGVEQWGAGALSLRVDDAGHDEVAVVAGAFNAAATRVEQLLASQKALLAHASHELRSPLARMRMAVELWLARPGPELRAEIVRNLAEIDELVEEILLASRLDYNGPDVERCAPVDLLGLAAEEAARFDASVDSIPEGIVEINGDAALLRRLIRNLLENASKHGRPPIHVAVTHTADKARIVVSDHGAGIAPCERERVFEPFYRPAGRIESAGGWGLGLSLVRQIAMRHGGNVVCEAEPDGESRFVVELASRKLPAQ
jgi:signal transduction histidine kinase